jgi:hypothetical protein
MTAIVDGREPILQMPHRKLLLDSGISEEVIEQRGYFTTANKKRLESLGFAPSQRLVPALVIPIHGLQGVTTKIVLTSPDPEYREKLQHIQTILANLRQDERFFSIDEFGPFSIKMKGGKRLVAPDEYAYVP